MSVSRGRLLGDARVAVPLDATCWIIRSSLTPWGAILASDYDNM